MIAANLRQAIAATGQKETKVGELCAELGITRQALYRHISPDGSLRPDGKKLLGSSKPATGKIRSESCEGVQAEVSPFVRLDRGLTCQVDEPASNFRLVGHSANLAIAFERSPLG